MFGKTGRSWLYADPTYIWVPPPPASGTRDHLNSTLPPDDINVSLEFTYLSTDPNDDSQTYVDALTS